MPKSSIRRDSVKGTKTKPPRMKYCGGSGASWRTKGRIAAHCKVSSFLASVRMSNVQSMSSLMVCIVLLHCIADCSVNVLICVNVLPPQNEIDFTRGACWLREVQGIEPQGKPIKSQWSSQFQRRLFLCLRKIVKSQVSPTNNWEIK